MQKPKPVDVLSLPLAAMLAMVSLNCGGGRGGSPTAPPVVSYSIAGQLFLQNPGPAYYPNTVYTILGAEIQLDGRTIAPCEQTNTPIVGGAQSLCANIYRASGVSAGSHTLACHLTRQTDASPHLYYCYGALQVFDASGTEVSRRQLGTVSGQLKAGDTIEIQISVP